MHSRDKYLLAGLVLFSLCIRVWGLGDITFLKVDERLHVPSSENYAVHGQYAPDTFAHPPMKYITLYAGMKIFGDNPCGWRMRNAVLGGLSVLVLFLLALELWPDQRVAWLAALLLALDPLHVFVSRTTYEEVMVSFFFLAGLYLSIRYMKAGGLYLPASGLFFGLAVATKWYFVPAVFIVLFFTLAHAAKEGGRRWLRAADVFSSYIILPLGIYILTFYAWFGRGYGPADFLQMQVDAYRELQHLVFEQWYARDKGPLKWFLRPVVFGQGLGPEAPGRYHVFMTNFPFMMMTAPAFLYTAYMGLKSRDRRLLMVMLSCLATYLLFLWVKRPIFLYSAAVVLPFALICVSYLVVSLLDAWKLGARCFAALLAAVALWGLYLYPLVAGMQVPRDLYWPLIAWLNP